MVFHRIHGTEWSPMPGWAHEDPTTRVLHRPSTTATLHLAAVAAQAARRLRRFDPAYADRLLAAARSAYGAAHRHPILVAPDDEGRFGGGPYGDPDPSDDFYWAAAELWLATGEQRFLDDVVGSPWHRRLVFDDGGFDFDRVAAPARLDLAEAASRMPRGQRVTRSVSRRPRRLQDAAGQPAVGAAVRPGRRLGLGVQRPDPQQSRGARLRGRTDR